MGTVWFSHFLDVSGDLHSICWLCNVRFGTQRLVGPHFASIDRDNKKKYLVPMCLGGITIWSDRELFWASFLNEMKGASFLNIFAGISSVSVSFYVLWMMIDRVLVQPPAILLGQSKEACEKRCTVSPGDCYWIL